MSLESYVCVSCGCSESSPRADGSSCTWLRLDDVLGTGVCSGCPDAVSRWDASRFHTSTEPAERILDVIAAAEAAGLALYRYSHDDRVVAYQFEPDARVRGCNGEELKGIEVRRITSYIPIVDNISMVLHLFDGPAEALRQVLNTQQTLGSPTCMILGGGRNAGEACALLCLHPAGDSSPRYGVVDRRCGGPSSSDVASNAGALVVITRMERQADYLEQEDNRDIHVGDPRRRVPAISKELRYFAGELRKHLSAGV
jgi:hypothetical protein